MPMVMAGAALVGGAVSAYGSYTAGQDAKAQANYNARIAQEESGLIRANAAQEAGLIRDNAVLNEYRQRKQLEMNTGTQVAKYAKSGVAFTGSPLDVIADDIANQELEISINKWNSKSDELRTRNLGNQQANLRSSQAEMLKKGGESAARAGMWGAASTLLQSGGTAYDRFRKEKIGT